MNDTESTATTSPAQAESSQCDCSAYPLFLSMLRSKGVALEAPYTCQDIATLFGVTARTIQSKVKDGTLPSRKLIGGGRFLAIDIEHYLQGAAEPRPETVCADAEILAR